MLVQPSSAAAERVFSILTNSFSSQQESSLEDYIQCYNTTMIALYYARHVRESNFCLLYLSIIGGEKSIIGKLLENWRIA